MKTARHSEYKQSIVDNFQSLRMQIRDGIYTGVTSGQAPGLLQGNVVILPKESASDFLMYCHKNPVACPLIYFSDPGDPILPRLGHNLDIRKDIPEYQIYQHGFRTDTATDISHLWQSDLVTFVLGCSFSFEDALIKAGLPIRNTESQQNVSMYRTSIPTVPAGCFSGNLVVSMRPFRPADAIRAIQITTPLTKAHGAPIHFGDPLLLGIDDINKPDFGDPVSIAEDEVPVFWSCGVTSQVALEEAKLPFAITQAPGKMLITEILNEEFSLL